jgi:peptide/nickel transport system permease protein
MKNKKKKEKSRIGMSQGQEVMYSLMHNPSAVLGITIILVLIVLAILAPVIAPYDYLEMNLAEAKQGPSALHIFGTDDLGRDIFSRILYGGRYSMSLGVLSVGLGALVATIIGSVAGYFGGWVDNLLMRLMDVLSAIPGMLLSIIVAAALGTAYHDTVIAMAIGNVAALSRILRAQFLSIREEEYVEAARAANCTNRRIIFSHILPNAIMPMVINCTSRLAAALLFCSSLSFIGLGVQPPEPEWGAMLAGARSYIRTYPYMLIFPGVFIAISVVGFTLVGDSVRDAMDPKLRK